MTLDHVVITLGEQPYTLGQLILLPLFLVVAYFVIKFSIGIMERRLTKSRVDPDVIHLVRRIVYVLALILVVFTALDLLNVPLTAFAFVSGAIAIGVGFGAQNIINNFISGWILMWERPIRIGDFLEIGDQAGTVESIDTRSTRIRRVDGVHMLVPNSSLLENTVVNWTLIDKLTRTRVRVGVAYGSPVRLVSDLILQAVEEHEAALSEPAVKVIFEDFGDNALIFDVYFWINATAERDLRVVRSDIRFRMAELFEDNGVIVAFPQRDIHLDGSLKLLGQSDAT